MPGVVPSGPPYPPAAPPGAALVGLRDELEADITGLEKEHGEIDLLMEQMLVEIERHAERRSRVEQRLTELEATPGADAAELSETRDSLVAVTRREMLFDAQRQVLEGKQLILARYLQRLVEMDNSLAALTQGPSGPMASVGLRPLAAASGTTAARGMSQTAMTLRSQEDMRRTIVRQLHDGPAQAIANIGLQAEIVERLVEKQDGRAAEEIHRLRELVQQALDTTKAYIFEIRPMVLDDLGLAPTIRRIASDRSRRSGINVDFDSRGIEVRLDPDIESALFRSIDEAVNAFLEMRPPSVLVRMDWSEHEIKSSVEGTWPRVIPEGQAESSDAAAARTVDTPPALLAMMEEERLAEREANRATRSLPPGTVAAIESRALAVGLRLTMRDDGQVMELVATVRH